MQNYSLYDMFGLIKLGVWQGGKIDTVGYVGRAVRCDSEVSKELLSGLYVSYDVIILQDNEVVDGVVNLMLALYEPYQQGFRKFRLRIDVESSQELTNRLIKLIYAEPKRIVELDNRRDKSFFKYERKYIGDYTSMYSGRSATTRRHR